MVPAASCLVWPCPALQCRELRIIAQFCETCGRAVAVDALWPVVRVPLAAAALIQPSHSPVVSGRWCHAALQVLAYCDGLAEDSPTNTSAASDGCIASAACRLSLLQVGTLSAMPPELLQHGRLSPAVDIYRSAPSCCMFDWLCAGLAPSVANESDQAAAVRVALGLHRQVHHLHTPQLLLFARDSFSACR